MTVELVHPVDASEIPLWSASMVSAFLEDPAENARWDEARRRNWRPDRAWGARADGRWVATLRTLPLGLGVPGPAGAVTELQADALTAVTVTATHRRRGLLRRMLTGSLAEAHARGDAVGILLAAEWPIYGRFGYAPATWSTRYTIDPRRPGARLDPVEGHALRQVEDAELHAIAPGLFEASRAARPGGIERPAVWWASRLGQDGLTAPKTAELPPVHVVVEDADGPAGFVSWASTPRLAPADGAAVSLLDLHARSDEAYRALWAYLVGIDRVATVATGWRPVDEPARFLFPDGRALATEQTEDHLWVRLLDVAAALSARTYAVADRIVLEVLDDAPGGYAAGRWALDGGPEGATCRAASSALPDLRIPQRTLASAYLGGATLAATRFAGRVDEFTPGAAARLQAMLATPVAPWCATDF